MNDAPQPTHVHYHQAQSNGMGTAAGVCSIIGIVSCGILCPIGLILGLMSMGREPKGMAITGVVLGAIGTLAYTVVFIIFGGAILVMCGSCIGLSNMAAELAEQQNASRPAAETIIAYYEENSALPAQADADLMIAPFTHEGHGFRYQSTYGSSFLIKHPGDDGQWDTADDWQTSWDAEFDINDPWDEPNASPESDYDIDPVDEIDGSESEPDTL